MSTLNEKPRFKLPYDTEKWTQRFEDGIEDHEEKHKLIYRELVNILGSRYVSDDRGVLEAYGKERQTFSIMSKGRSEFVVLPGRTEDVQKIIALANRYNFPFSVMSTGAWGTCFAAEGIPYWCQIDLKRMNKLEIDEKNMYAIIEPYVSHAELQVESMKRGLYNGTPSAGCQSSSLANHVQLGYQLGAYRTGACSKNILGMEWILPNGEILSTGTLATPGAGYFWGEGPGPDARALLRGLLGSHASLGIVTRIAVKLFPWPGPPVWPVDGTAPHMTVNLPPERFRWYFFGYSTIAEAVNAMRELSKVEIGAIVQRHSLWLMRVYAARSREEDAKLIREKYWEKALGNAPEVITVGLWGWTSEKQVEYEEMLLKEIVEETGGKWVSDEIYQLSVIDSGIDCIRSSNCVRQAARRGLGGDMVDFEMDGFGDMVRAHKFVTEVQQKYTPPLLDQGGAAWIAPYDFGHHALIEIYARSPERNEESELRILPGVQELRQRLMQEGSLDAVVAKQAQNIVGSSFTNIHRITAELKRALDPNSIANPTRFIDMEAMKELGK
ncbi:FAD-binding oxidoreductase [Chloroflexota bacterium]